MTSARRAVRALSVGFVVALGASGCSVTLESLPLPSPGVSEATYPISAVFTDALNLPYKAKVKLTGTDIGEVREVVASDYTARVTMDIRQDVHLPRDTTAELRQATPLGDVYVALTAHSDPSLAGDLAAGSTIPITSTSAAATVEDLLASVSVLINGGALTQLQGIVNELDAALAGRQGDPARIIVQLTSTLHTLNSRSATIDRVLRNSDALTRTLAAGRGQLGDAIDAIGPAVGALAANNRRIIDLLAGLERAGGKADRILREAGDNVSSLISEADKAFGAVSAVGDRLQTTLRTVSELTPEVVDSARGTALANYMRISWLSLGVLNDRGSRVPDATDAQAFVGSLSDTLARVYGRITGRRLTPTPRTSAPADGPGQENAAPAGVGTATRLPW
ncbi:MCE family protein [Williamsia sp. SKLECPSW1]